MQSRPHIVEHLTEITVSEYNTTFTKLIHHKNIHTEHTDKKE